MRCGRSVGFNVSWQGGRGHAYLLLRAAGVFGLRLYVLLCFVCMMMPIRVLRLCFSLGMVGWLCYLALRDTPNTPRCPPLSACLFCR
ncbi:hypothetical protein B0T22DRAFT_183935 [Podospora appendiculata]|uniref:Uncharacterized protein n=1 Tax=Podospora appendiculata TaxID=314037 RepID=A0AAE0XCB6_9PEZI|nr:hypothetical protein B0T22DRAFT_183935 [Podospora appendiculata]